MQLLSIKPLITGWICKVQEKFLIFSAEHLSGHTWIGYCFSHRKAVLNVEVLLSISLITDHLDDGTNIDLFFFSSSRNLLINPFWHFTALSVFQIRLNVNVLPLYVFPSVPLKMTRIWTWSESATETKDLRRESCISLPSSTLFYHSYARVHMVKVPCNHAVLYVTVFRPSW